MNLVFTKWWMRSLCREVRKGKFKAIFRYFYDSTYRTDIKYIADLTTGQGKLTSRMSYLKLNEIHFSHSINYPKWVNRLSEELLRTAEVPPIKVMYDYSKRKWIVIDGNHRLMAMKRVLPFYARVPVKILYPQGRGNARLAAFAKQAHDPGRQSELLAHLDHGDIE